MVWVTFLCSRCSLSSLFFPYKPNNSLWQHSQFRTGSMTFPLRFSFPSSDSSDKFLSQYQIGLFPKCIQETFLCNTKNPKHHPKPRQGRVSDTWSFHKKLPALFTSPRLKDLYTAGPKQQLSPPLHEIHRQSVKWLGLWCCNNHRTEACSASYSMAAGSVYKLTLVSSFCPNSHRACCGKFEPFP